MKRLKIIAAFSSVLALLPVTIANAQEGQTATKSLYFLSTIIPLAQNPVKPMPLTFDEFETELTKRGGNRDALPIRVLEWFGADKLASGARPKVHNLKAAFAIEAPSAKTDPIVVDENNKPLLKLQRVAKSNIYAGILTVTEGSYTRWHYKIGDESKADGHFEAYTTPPEMQKQSGVPEGKVTQMPVWKSAIFDGATRDWWIYVPAQYTPDKPACVMIFQDGGGAKNYAPVVFDNLIAKKEMPVTIGIFLNPGTFEGGRSNRSVEYDTLSDKYSRFLLEEILPEVEKTYKLKQDAQSRAVAGLSSGGIWRVHGGMAATGQVPQGLFVDRVVREFAGRGNRNWWRAQLSDSASQKQREPEAYPRFPSGRRGRSGQSIWKLAPRQSIHGQVPAMGGL